MIRPAATELFICGARGQVPGQTVHSGQGPAFDSPPGAEVTSLVPGGMRPARADPGHRASGLPRNHLLAPPAGVGSCHPPTTRQNANSCEDGVGRGWQLLAWKRFSAGDLVPAQPHASRVDPDAATTDTHGHRSGDPRGDSVADHVRAAGRRTKHLAKARSGVREAVRQLDQSTVFSVASRRRSALTAHRFRVPRETFSTTRQIQAMAAQLSRATSRSGAEPTQRQAGRPMHRRDHAFWPCWCGDARRAVPRPAPRQHRPIACDAT